MIDDETLMAFVDGELDEMGRARVERAAAGDPALQARIDRQRKLRATLAAFYGPAAEEEVPEHLRAMLESNVVAFPAAKPRTSRPLWQSVLALAATLVLGLAVGRTLLAPAAGPVGVENGRMLAQGQLAAALDTQLASAQAPDAATRIGTSFAAADGRLCRTFESAAMAGLACRGDQGWQLMMTTAGSAGPRSDYRQAGSANPLVAQAAQDLMAGEPLDAAAERRARDSGWRRR
ncbi:MAG: anti-sigma factor [Sphingomonadaceae bacterium]|nr:anti-sigma factor [Sphingomonadaceae bacterium]